MSFAHGPIVDLTTSQDTEPENNVLRIESELAVAQKALAAGEDAESKLRAALTGLSL